jgi:hypothetical protein
MVDLADGTTANNLTDMLMSSLELKGGLDKATIVSKLVYFGADGCSAFQGRKNGIIVQIQKNFSPFASSIHCHAHKVNLAVKTLSELDVFYCIEELMRLSHAYFAHSLKKYNEYKSFGQTIDTKGLKLLKNVTTRWLSLLSPMRRVLSKYRMILGKMHIDCINKKEKV